MNPRRSNAFTLIEMVVSLTVMSIIFLAMGSVLMLTAKAVPGPNDADALNAEAAEVVQQMVDELQTCTTITDARLTHIAFTVPDRNGDSIDETIHYDFAGSVGNPVTRQYNGGAVVNMAIANSFKLTYDIPSTQVRSVCIKLVTNTTNMTNYTAIVNTLNLPTAP